MQPGVEARIEFPKWKLAVRYDWIQMAAMVAFLSYRGYQQNELHKISVDRLRLRSIVDPIILHLLLFVAATLTLILAFVLVLVLVLQDGTTFAIRALATATATGMTTNAAVIVLGPHVALAHILFASRSSICDDFLRGTGALARWRWQRCLCLRHARQSGILAIDTSSQSKSSDMTLVCHSVNQKKVRKRREKVQAQCD